MHPTTPGAVARPRRLVVAVLLTLAVVTSSAVGATLTSAPAGAATVSTGQMAQYLFSTINALRKAQGRPALKLNSRLVSSAAPHSRLMQRHNALTKQFRGEPAPATRIARTGFPAVASHEIVGVVRNASELSAWQRRIMANTWVRAVVYSTRMTHVGIGIVSDPTHRKIWITEDFAQVKTPPLTVQYADAVLALMNTQRALHGRAPLRMNSLLVRSAHAHNLWMARYNTMSHQLTGEAFFANRILSAGYDYLNAGENIGWNSVRTLTGVLDLQKIMYNEVPPEDGHRQNILNANFRDVGIDVYFDSHNNKLWLTQDFGSLG